MAKVIYEQIFNQVNLNLNQAFSEEIQCLKDANTEITVLYAAQEQRTDLVLAIVVQSGRSGSGPGPAAPEKCDRGTQSGAEEFVITISNLVLFETFTSDTSKCNKAKSIILDLVPADRSSDLVLDHFKAGLSVVAACGLAIFLFGDSSVPQLLRVRAHNLWLHQRPPVDLAY
ncbi:hypothetical protein FIBSPDRAFT_887197 [Athelia psychrophila]|uniref:Uncharacterized protein n=1 Tax=Athelia psychrophila TaxID=1759441 RepID=A0A166Q3F1_9AGAM|nr:hypothetical protein FIBSPDRAFT_887197 [Fibularhizoctonia sp. CBS 109695]